MAERKYGVVRLDSVKSCYNGHIHSVVYADDILENGMVGIAGDLLPGERELRELKVPEGTDEPLVLVYSPEINYKQDRITDGALENFFIEKGVPARAYTLEKDDIYSVTKDMIKPIGAEVVKGNFLVAEAGSLKLKEVVKADLTGTEAFVAKIEDKEILGTATVIGQAGTISRMLELVVIRVLKNA